MMHGGARIIVFRTYIGFHNCFRGFRAPEHLLEDGWFVGGQVYDAVAEDDVVRLRLNPRILKILDIPCRVHCPKSVCDCGAVRTKNAKSVAAALQCVRMQIRLIIPR